MQIGVKVGRTASSEFALEDHLKLQLHKASQEQKARKAPNDVLKIVCDDYAITQLKKFGKKTAQSIFVA